MATGGAKSIGDVKSDLNKINRSVAPGKSSLKGGGGSGGTGFKGGKGGKY